MFIEEDSSKEIETYKQVYIVTQVTFYLIGIFFFMLVQNVVLQDCIHSINLQTIGSISKLQLYFLGRGRRRDDTRSLLIQGVRSGGLTVFYRSSLHSFLNEVTFLTDLNFRLMCLFNNIYRSYVRSVVTFEFKSVMTLLN